MRTRVINLLSHLAGWVLFFSLILAFLAGPEKQKSFFTPVTSWPFLVFALTYLVLFYLNYFLLVPVLYLKRKYVLYFGVICLLFAAVYTIRPFDGMISMNPPPGQPVERKPPPAGERPGPGGRDINSIILFVTIWSLSTSVPVIRQWRLTEKRALQAETDKANAELSFLKAQINPHFLFNTLNNIYSLAVTKHDNTAPSIMKLSNIMRYVTDEAGQDLVPLDSEIGCMQDFIDLQRMRLRPTTDVQVAVKGNTTDKMIAPLLLMTFVENVFKYGVSSHESSVISIRLETDNEAIRFFCQNKLFPIQRKTERTGIGIANARQRLLHLYPGRHELNISEQDGLFTVELTLQV